MNKEKSKDKKNLTAKQWNIIYLSIIVISFVLIVTLVSVFVVSKVKNDQLQKEYNQANEKYLETEEDSELNKDPNYREAREKDITDEKGDVIYIKHL